MPNAIENALKEADFNETAVRCYLRLLEGGASARQLAENLNIPRPSVYDYLRLLIERGLVVEHNEGHKKIFYTDDPQRLTQLLQEKTDRIQKQTRELRAVLSSRVKTESGFEPKIRFFYGPDGIRNVLRDLLWHENIETLTMWPIKNMLELVDPEYLEELNRKRIRRNISIRGIWPQDQLVDLHKFQFLGVSPGHLRTMHLAPPGTTWPMSYWLFADKVAFISSKREGFSFLVTSKDFVDLMRVQFEFVWKATKPFMPKSYNDVFLKTI